MNQPTRPTREVLPRLISGRMSAFFVYPSRPCYRPEVYIYVVPISHSWIRPDRTTRVPVVIQPSHGRYVQFSGLAPYSHVEFSAVAIRDHTSESRLVAMQTMGGAVRYIYPQREGFVPGHDAVTDAFFSLVVLDIEIERHSVVCSAAHDRRGAPALT